MRSQGSSTFVVAIAATTMLMLAAVPIA